MGGNLLRHASLSLYNHFDTHEVQHHDTIFNHRIDILPYRYVSQTPSLCLCRVCARTYMRMCVCVWICLCTNEFRSLRVCQNTPQEWYVHLTNIQVWVIFDEHLVR